MFLSTNNGLNWTQTALNNKYINSLAAIGNNVFAGVTNDGIYVTSNNGISWTQTVLNNKTIRSLATFGNNIIASTDSNGVLLSTNHGASWINKNQGFFNLTSTATLYVTNNYIYAGTYGNSVWRRSLSEIIGIQNISTETPSKYSLSQNYPNPFNPVTKIRFDVPSVRQSLSRPVGTSLLVALKVYDVMGREVQTLVNERLQPGTYETSFDGSALNSGVYFYKMMTDGFTETKKMLLIK